MIASKEHILSSLKPVVKRIVLTDKPYLRTYVVKREGVGTIKTPYGFFWLFDFSVNDRWKKYHVLVKGDVTEGYQLAFKDRDIVYVRMDSGCLTGQAFHDITCDCRQQLHRTMKEMKEGIIVCMPRQDGRGMGLPFKLATLQLQHFLGMDTVEAAKVVAGSDHIDDRDYHGVMAILKFFGFTPKTKIDIATNNPRKVAAFEENGYTVVHTTPVLIKPTKHTKKHMEAKQRHLGHMNLV